MCYQSFSPLLYETFTTAVICVPTRLLSLHLRALFLAKFARALEKEVSA